MTMYYLCKR